MIAPMSHRNTTTVTLAQDYDPYRPAPACTWCTDGSSNGFYGYKLRVKVCVRVIIARLRVNSYA